MLDGSATDLVQHYGYAGLFVAVLLQNSGVPLPAEAMFIAATVLAERGVLSEPWVLGLAIAAAAAGHATGWLVGRHLGREVLERYGHRVGLGAARLNRFEVLLARHAAWALVVARFTAVPRALAGLVSGATGLRWWRFFLLDLAGAFAWAAVTGGLVWASAHGVRHVLAGLVRAGLEAGVALR